ncbi:MAG: tetratricopeptide repeat protein [Phycisphaerales bacterium]
MRALLTISVVVLCSHALIAQDGDRALRTANGLLQRGLHAEAASEYAAALQTLDNADARDEARYGLAVARYNMGEDAAAIRALEQIEGGPRFAFRADADVLLMHLHFRQEDYARAASSGRAAAGHRDHAAWASTAALLIESLHRAGENADAVRAYTRFESDLRRDDQAHRRASLFAGISQATIARKPTEHATAAEWLGRVIMPRGRDGLTDAALFHQANALYAAGDAAGAIASLERASVDASTVRPQAMLRLAVILRLEARPGEAANVLRVLAEQAPRFSTAQVHYELGRALLDIDQPEEAIRAFERSERRADPDLADDVAFWHAKAALRRGRHEEAAERLRLAIKQHPTSPLIAEMKYDRAIALQRDGQPEAAARAFGLFVADHGDHPLAPDALFSQASLLLEVDQVDESAGVARSLSRQFTDHPLASSAAFLQAEAAYRSKNYEAAARGFAPLVEADDDSLADQARFRLGMSFLAMGRADQAEPHLEAVVDGVRTQPAFVPALFALGDIAFDAEQWEQAESRFAEYIAVAGTQAASVDAAMLKLALARGRQGDTTGAIESLTQMLSEWPHSEHAPHALFELGQMHVAQGNDQAARRFFTTLPDRHEDSRFAPHALRHLAGIAARSGEHERAAGLYAQAADRGGRPMARIVALDHAKALINAGEPAQAARLLHDAEGPARAWYVIALSRSADHQAAVDASEDYTPRDLGEQDTALYQYALAASLRNTGQRERATRMLEQVVAGGSSVAPHAALDLADAYLADADYARAADLLEPVSQRTDVPTTLASAATYKAAWARYQLNDHRSVVRLLQDFNDDALAGPSALLLGESLLALKRGREAAEQLARAISAGGQGVDADAALLRLGEAHAAAQDWNASLEAYARHRREHARSPRWFMAEFGLGWALENAGKHRQAINHYQAVVDKHEGETAARAQFQLGECLFALGQHEDAVRELLRVDILHASPTWSPAALFEAGRCFEAMGKVGEARAQYRAVQDRFAESSWATAAGERLRAIAGPGGTASGRGG